jgi:hypothetical protein
MTSKSAAIIHIPTPVGKSFTKAQQLFNRLSKRVQKLEKELTAFRTAAEDVRRRVQAEYRPLQQQHDTVRAKLVTLLDTAYRQEKKLSTLERTKIRELMANAFGDLPGKGFPDLQAVLDGYAPDEQAQVAAAAQDAAHDRATADLMRQMMELQYGIRFDPVVDISSPERFQQYANQLLEEQYARQKTEQAAAEARRATQKKSAKQLAAEARREAEEKATTQSVRALYRDLVKVLHPDREPDEAEKIRKTALLQRVTAAYENNELLTLLRLQMELQRLDPAHLETLADAQLAPYNKLLRDQVNELEQTLYEEQVTESEFGDHDFGLLSAQGLRNQFEWKLGDLQRRVDLLAADVADMQADVVAVKRFLKTFRLPK